MEEVGWVIVRTNSQSALEYWNGTEPKYPRAFSSENLEAVRFARKQDAEACMAGMEMCFGARVEDHMWCDNTRVLTAPPPADELRSGAIKALEQLEKSLNYSAGILNLGEIQAFEKLHQFIKLARLIAAAESCTYKMPMAPVEDKKMTPEKAKIKDAWTRARHELVCRRHNMLDIVALDEALNLLTAPEAQEMGEFQMVEMLKSVTITRDGPNNVCRNPISDEAARYAVKTLKMAGVIPQKSEAQDMGDDELLKIVIDHWKPNCVSKASLQGIEYAAKKAIKALRSAGVIRAKEVFEILNSPDEEAQERGVWRPMPCPRDEGIWRLYRTIVQDGGKGSWRYDIYQLCLNEDGGLVDADGNHHVAWSYEDYVEYQDIPKPPKDGGK